MSKKRLYTLEFDSQNVYDLNDANPSTENAFAYGQDVQAIAETSQAFGTETQAGARVYNFNINNLNNTSILFEGDNVHKELNPDDQIALQINEYSYSDLNIKSVSTVKENEEIKTKVDFDPEIIPPTFPEEKLVNAVLIVLQNKNGNFKTIIGNDTIGSNSSAFGNQVRTFGDDSHAEGYKTTTINKYSHAENYETLAGYGAHAEGKNTKALASFSHAEGIGTITTTPGSHVEGKYNEEDAEQQYLHILGNGRIEEIEDATTGKIATKIIRSNAHTIDKHGNAWFAGGIQIPAGQKIEIGEINLLEKINNIEIGADFLPEDDAVGKHVKTTDEATNTITYYGEIFNNYSGNVNDASGYLSHAEGKGTKAYGSNSHAEGFATITYANNSHAEGYQCQTGLNSQAKDVAAQAHAEGYQTIASGNSSHAEGHSTIASGVKSHAEGYGTIASKENQHAQGKYNIEDTTSDGYAHIVGNGTSNTNRSNCHTLDWNGDTWFAGRIQCGGTGWDNNSTYVPMIFLKTTAPDNTKENDQKTGQIGDLWIVLESESS